MAEKSQASYFQFPAFAPDIADLNSGVLFLCQGVYPSPTGYKSAKDLVAVGGGGSITGAALEGIIAPYSASSVECIVGTAAKLYAKTTAAASWTDITRTVGGAYTAVTWSFCTFGTATIATNGTDVVQSYTTGSGTAAAALAGSPPNFNAVAACGDFIFGLGTNANQRVLRWSGINSATSWTVGTNLCDEQEFPDGGQLMGAYGDKEGFILQRDAVRRFRFIPGDVVNIFEFEKLPGVPGCINSSAWTVCGNTIYYFSQSGFVALDSNGLRYIGRDRVDRTMVGNLSRIIADIVEQRIIIPVTNFWFTYDIRLDRWTSSVPPAGFECWFTRRELGSNTVNYPCAISGSALYGLNGKNQAVLIRTAPIEIAPARRVFLNGFRINTDWGSSTLVPTVITSEADPTTGVAVTFAYNISTKEAQGMCSARYIKYQLAAAAETADTTAYTYLDGVTPWTQIDGEI